MKQAFKQKAQNAALISGFICLLISLRLAFSFLNENLGILFWLALLITLLSAILAFPRPKALAAIFLAGLSLWIAGNKPFARYHSSEKSPDQRFNLVIYSVPLPFIFPGHGSDAKCYVQLQKTDGQILHEGFVEMIQIAKDARWHEHQVEVGRGDGGLNWELPAE